jgi:formate C-acetyltransferase
MEIVNVRVKETIYQNMTLGGRSLEGRDECNELSGLCLDATVALRTNQPSLSFRWHPGISPEFWSRVCSGIAQGGGMPAVYNDEVTIPSLVAQGVDPADAADYGIAGCAELCVSGKEMGVENGGHVNLAKALELALNDGCSTVTGKRIGLATGRADCFASFEQVWEAYRAQVEYLCGLTMLAEVIAGEVHKHRGHCPLMSSMLDDCVSTRRDLVLGGARYKLPGINVFGGANVYDGLLAVKRCVFERASLTMEQLCTALREDFAGREQLRRSLARSGPRFGNDHPQTDAFAQEVNALHASFCSRHVESRGGRFLTGVWPVGGHVALGRFTGATPDGRRRGTPLVDGVGSCQGADANGPTALLRSVARLDFAAHFPKGSTCNIRFAARLLSSPSALRSLGDLVWTFLSLGGHQLQVNVVDSATLRAAQARPEEHRDLLVRVGGFTAHFVSLPRDSQDEIISRTEHPL